MDIKYFMKLQNAYGTKNNREKNLAKINRNADRHFTDTFDTHDVLVNNKPMQLMIIKDTDGNVYKKKIKSRHGDKFNVGDYIEWNNQVWMVTLLDPDDKTWNRGYMYLCTVALRWQSSNGEIVERFAFAEDYTKYSMGETGNSTVNFGDYQYGLTLPVDENTMKLKRGNRFVIDYEGNYPPDTYRLTGKKVYLNDNRYFNRGGVVTLTLSYNFFNKNKDKLITLEDGSQVWICDYHSPTVEPEQPDISDETDLFVSVLGNKNLKCGFERTYIADFKDKNGSTLDSEFKWNVVSGFKVNQEIIGNKIKLLVDDEDCIFSSFLLQVIMNNEVVSEIEISVVEGF